VKRALGTLRALLVTIFLAPLRFYSRFISPGLPRRCKYEPTCSAYAEQAVRELGILRGTVLAGWRLLRCNPWSHGGWDPVSDRKLFRSDAPAHGDRGHEPGAPA
jgi:putative membrane protein insertion efficiency factor